MALYFVTGDILASNVQAFVNPVNCQGVMGKGLALQFKRKYPAYFNRYKELCAEGVLRLGRVNVFSSDKAPVLVSFPTKNHWKELSNYPTIDLGLMSLADAIQSLNISSIAIPMLGCGEGKLDWSDVRTLIVNRLSHLQSCSIYVYGPMF